VLRNGQQPLVAVAHRYPRHGVGVHDRVDLGLARQQRSVDGHASWVHANTIFESRAIDAELHQVTGRDLSEEQALSQEEVRVGLARDSTAEVGGAEVGPTKIGGISVGRSQLDPCVSFVRWGSPALEFHGLNLVARSRITKRWARRRACLVVIAPRTSAVVS